MANPPEVEPQAKAVVGGDKYLNGTTSQAVRAVPGDLCGIFVASSSAGTIKLWDNTAGSGAVLVNTFTATAGTWYPVPVRFGTALFITVGGTIDYTVIFR